MSLCGINCDSCKERPAIYFSRDLPRDLPQDMADACGCSGHFTIFTGPPAGPPAKIADRLGNIQQKSLFYGTSRGISTKNGGRMQNTWTIHILMRDLPRDEWHNQRMNVHCAKFATLGVRIPRGLPPHMRESWLSVYRNMCFSLAIPRDLPDKAHHSMLGALKKTRRGHVPRHVPHVCG